LDQENLDRLVLVKFPSAPLRASLDRCTVSSASRSAVPIRSAAGVIGSLYRVFRKPVGSSHPLRCGRHWILNRSASNTSQPVILFPSAPLRASLDLIEDIVQDRTRSFPSAPLRASLDQIKGGNKNEDASSHPLRCGRHWILSKKELVHRLYRVPIRSAAGVIGSKMKWLIIFIF